MNLNENFMENFTFEAVICNTKETVTVVVCVDVWETITKNFLGCTISNKKSFFLYIGLTINFLCLEDKL